MALGPFCLASYLRAALEQRFDDRLGQDRWLTACEDLLDSAIEIFRGRFSDDGYMPNLEDLEPVG